jgi:diguanylate cyclase
LRATDFLGRVGGDEFAIILWHTTGDQAEQAADGILRLFDDYRYQHQGRVLTTTASLGIAVLKGNVSAEDVLAQADSACYRAKTKGRNRWERVHPNGSDLALAREQAVLAPQIKDALREDRFELWLQPIVPLQTDGRPTNLFEVLLRMRNAQNQLLLPASFIPTAERLGYMTPIDHWVLDHALDLLRRHSTWQLSINLSAQSLADPDLLSYLTRLVETHRIAPGRATLEITETSMIVNLTAATSLMRELRQLGFNLALDDFGAGFTSLGYLRELPVDYLKIDRQFIQPLATDAFNQALVKSIGDLAHRLGRWTVAEGVETAQVLEVVRSLGMDFGQGWQLGPPQAMASVN